MRQPEFAAIQPYLEQAVGDIDYFVTGLEDHEKAMKEWRELYDLMAAGETPPEVKGLGKPVRLTKTQYMALIYGTKVRQRKRPDEPLDERQGTPLTDEEREAILAELDRSDPLSDAQRESLAYWARGGWQDSSRRAAAWLRSTGETVAANGIEEALNRLPDEPRDATALADYREAVRTAAEYVKTILEQYPIQPPGANPADTAAGATKDNALLPDGRRRKLWEFSEQPENVKKSNAAVAAAWNKLNSKDPVTADIVRNTKKNYRRNCKPAKKAK